MRACTKRAYVLLLLLFFTLFTTVRACPDTCVCKWKNGKQTVECGSRNLQMIPDNIDSNTQVLEFSTNKLQKISGKLFLKLDLINLQRIYLSQNRITHIDQRAFNGLTNLVELDLSGNLLEVVPTASFVDSPSLMRLTLSYNPIKILKKNSFNHLTFLHSLELSNCNIDYVEDGAFIGLHSLEWLHLDGNKLTTIKGNNILPESLRGIELQGNYWRCNCDLLDLHSWLTNLKVPYSIEPTCKYPKKFAGRPIKLIPENELACLPVVAPTALYLEIAEGRNISLLCHINAIPEAQISWWFQGQILQNDSFIAPGMRLMYYIEDGIEEKRSELFIYNANSEDNGTFICNAENAAGSSQSNFTVRIILKEEPIVIIVAFPFEYILATLIAAAILILTILILMIISIIKCRNKRDKIQKKEQTKEVTLQYHKSQDNTTKSESEITGGDSFLMSRSCDDLLRAISPITIPQIKSPTSLGRYQIEPNPDLINDAESGKRRDDGDGQAISDTKEERSEALMHQSMVQFPINCIRNGTKLYNIHSWDPSCSIVDVEGYPVDYGLPKMHTVAPTNFYRTLPYNRSAKRQSAAVPLNRYSREAEFLLNYCSDVRYTADGYPVRPNNVDTNLPSPPEGYKGNDQAPASLPCCSAMQWPQQVHQQRIPANIHLLQSERNMYNSNKRCVSAQTENSNSGGENNAAKNVGAASGTHLNCSENRLNAPGHDTFNEVLTESPDEGYEGEPNVV